VKATRAFSPSRLRQARGSLSVETVAAAAGVSSMTVRNWEAGTHEPAASKLNAISAITGKPLDFFFTNGRAA